MSLAKRLGRYRCCEAKQAPAAMADFDVSQPLTTTHTD